MKEYEIGISTDCECGDTFKETLQNIKTAGFKNIMLAEKSGDLENNLRLAREMGFEIPFVHLGYRHPYKNMNAMWKTGPENQEFIKNLIRRLEILHKYNVKTAVVHPCAIGDLTEGEILSSGQGLATMKTILENAKKLDVNIAVENLNEPDTVFTSYLLDNIDSPDFGFCYDVGHKNLYYPQKNILENYNKRCFAIHLHDNLMNFNSDNREHGFDIHYLPFDGKIDFEKELSIIAESNYEGVLMLELHRCKNETIEPYLIYKNLSVADYLMQAYRRGEKLAEIFARKRARIRQKKS